MISDKMIRELINSLEKVVEFYEMNDDGTGEPFMALGFSKDVVNVFENAKRTLENVRKEMA